MGGVRGSILSTNQQVHTSISDRITVSKPVGLLLDTSLRQNSAFHTYSKELGAPLVLDMFTTATGYIKESLKRAREGNLPIWRQLVEMIILELCYSIGPGFYHKARFWRRDMPFREKTRYRVGKRYINLVAKINDRNYYKLSQHKLSEKALLRLFGIPTAEFIGFFHPINGQASDGYPLTSGKQFAELMHRLFINSAAIKMPEGSCGKGFDIIDFDATRDDQIYSRALQREFPINEYMQIKASEFDDQGILIESVIQQHPALTNLNATSVNTLRLWVRQSRHGVNVKSGLLKIGGRNSLTDYTTTGGLAVPLDVCTGSLGEPWLRPPANNALAEDTFDRCILEGFEIPFWQDVLLLAKQCLLIFPKHNFAGMDIAITKDGPLIVEINVVPDPIHAATVDIPTLDLLDDEQ